MIMQVIAICPLFLLKSMSIYFLCDLLFSLWVYVGDLILNFKQDWPVRSLEPEDTQGGR